TSPIGSQSRGNLRPKKPLPEIAVAHGVAYVAVTSAGFPQDLQRKVKKAISIRGPKYIQVHSPCPLGWRHESGASITVARAAVETGLYPLLEFESGTITTRRQIIPKPVEEYLKLQGRFKHLLKDPDAIKEIQDIANINIEKYNLKATSEG
ncbi:MAG: pyruvate ferredoxin oxidoreductase, partial [Candidatus Omnitrophica bacterium]|nr:pyruvate ferredoxin oxidoreductase [Candidatus Omnitrophota bacterium]